MQPGVALLFDLVVRQPVIAIPTDIAMFLIAGHAPHVAWTQLEPPRGARCTRRTPICNLFDNDYAVAPYIDCRYVAPEPVALGVIPSAAITGERSPKELPCVCAWCGRVARRLHLSHCPVCYCHGRAISEGAALCMCVVRASGATVALVALPRVLLSVTGERSPKELLP